MTIHSSALFQLFKYAVYALLAMNIYWFFDEESAAAALQFSGGVSSGDLIEAFSSTIDTAAWVALLLLFELETYVLEDHHFTRPVTWSLHGLRAVCYLFIVYALYGYVQNLEFLYSTTPYANLVDLCSLPAGEWSWADTLDEYSAVTAANCATLTASGEFFKFSGMPALVDAEGLRDIRYLGWVDVINAGAWLLVVLVLEIDVRLQERNRFEGLALKVSTAAKVALYSLLFLAAVYWGFNGDFVDFWDAFLWLVAFVFIELNVFEWRQEEQAAAAVT